MDDTLALHRNVAQIRAHIGSNYAHLCTGSMQKTPFAQGHFTAPHKQGRFALQSPADW
jgi:hypothetical protein